MKIFIDVIALTFSFFSLVKFLLTFSFNGFSFFLIVDSYIFGFILVPSSFLARFLPYSLA